MMALLIGSPALAGPLWDKVEYGQSMDDVRLIYPPSSTVVYHDDYVVLEPVTIAQGCPAVANIAFKDAKVKSVAIRGGPQAIQTCLARVRRQLTFLYGKPKMKRGFFWKSSDVDITLQSQIASPDDLGDREILLALTYYWVVYFEYHIAK